jgi:Zn-finger nucleic acid-binding protein
MCIVELHVTVANIEILTCAECCLYGEFVPPETIKCEIPFLIYEVSQQIFMQLINIKFHRSPFSGSQTDACGQTDGQQLDGHEANKAIFAANVPERNSA